MMSSSSPPSALSYRSRHAGVFRLLALALLSLLIILGGCGKDEEAGPQQRQGAGAAAGQRDGPRGGGRPEQPPTPVAVAAAAVGPIASYYHATATLEAERQAEILARVTGVVRQLHCEEGDFVEPDQPLLTVDNDEYGLRLKQAEATTAELQSRFERMERMRAEELSTEEEYQALKSELANAEADEGLARLDVSYTTVRAPFTGRVVQRLVDVGQNVNAGDPLFVVADFDPLLARIYVPSKEFRKLRQDQNVTLILDSSQQRLTGRIMLISPIIDPSSGTIKVTVEVPTYPAGTRPGDFAQVHIVTEQREDVVLVPKIAVVTEKGESVLYVAVDDRAERRAVVLGFTDDQHAEIVEGVTAGEPVVVRGQRSLKHGAPLRILEDGIPAAATPPARSR
jgi:membrane fusion protein (multidrug efflux system)